MKGEKKNLEEAERMQSLPVVVVVEEEEKEKEEGRLTKSPEGRQREAFCQREIGRFRGLAVVKRFIQPRRASAAKQISLFTTGSTFER